MRTRIIGPVALLAVLSMARVAGASDPSTLREQLKALPFKIAYESYVNGNSEIFVMNADGSQSGQSHQNARPQ